MNDTKATIILISFIIAGIVFIGGGIYFISQKYLSLLSDCAPNAEKAAKVVAGGKRCGYVALGIGAFTILCGVFTKIIPSIFPYLALVYVILLIAAFSVIIFSISANHRD